MSIPEQPDEIVEKFNNSTGQFVESFGSGNSCLDRFTISKKSGITASFLRVDVR